MLISFFGISLHQYSRTFIQERIRAILCGNTFCRIATIGPEFLLRARGDIAFRKNLEKADLRIADGSGISIGARLLYGAKIERFPGADLLHDILKEAENLNRSVFFAVRTDGLSSLEAIMQVFRARYPRLIIEGREYEIYTHEVKNGARADDVAHNFDVIFCNFGAPEQEYFLESLRKNAKRAKLVMGVGGACDFATGVVLRAPQVFRTFGMEWLWRLLLQPQRWRRIWRAVIVFPFFAIREFLHKRSSSLR